MRGHERGRKNASGAYSERVRLENAEADLRLKQLQIQALEDERELLPLRRREHELDIENAEIKRSLTLFGVACLGALVVAGAVLAVADPVALHRSGFDFLEELKLFFRVAA